MSTNVETKVDEFDGDIDALIGMPGGESVMTASNPPEDKPNVLTGDKENDKFLNEELMNGDNTPDNDKTATEQEINQMLEPKPPVEQQPKTNTSTIQKLIDDNVLFGFEGEDNKKISEYTDEDVKELIKANIEYQTEQGVKEATQNMFDSLPPEMQAAFDYVQNGGKDIKGMFKALSETVETRDLDPEKVEDQKKIIREFYTMTNWGSIEDIEEEITSLQDKGDLKKKALQFKPKLDASRQDVINKRIENQRRVDEQRRKQAETYAKSMYDTLSKPTLCGVKIDDNVRNKLYSGLMNANYPSITGQKTNMLGYLLEKYQWVEPKHDLIAEILWHIADPDSFKKAIASNVEKQTLEDTVRKLKTEEASGRKPASQPEERTAPKLRRNAGGFFSRQ